jgi:hypothetical protein
MLLSDAAAIHLFFYTLYRKPKYGLWTRQLTCYINLTAPSIIRKIYDLSRSTFLTTPNIAVHRLEHRLLLPELKLRLNDVPQALFYFILTFLTNIETVLLQVPITDYRPPEGVLYTAVEAIKNRSRDKHHTTPFQHIRTLILQDDPASPSVIGG